MSKILVLTAHPRSSSFCGALADAYGNAARAAGHEVRHLRLADISVDLLPPDYTHRHETGDWVAAVQTEIGWCEHLVIVTPLWWGGIPGAFKALLDRVLMPGFAFKYHRKGLGWDKLLKGRSAHVVLTADTPPLIFRWIFGRPLIRQFRIQILGFCGFSPVRSTVIGPVKTSTAAKRETWLAKMTALGRQGR